MKFDLPAFVNKMSQADGLAEDQVNSHVRMLKTMRLILDNKHTTLELLNQVSIQDIEWAFDLMLYWPDWEADIEEADLDHQGVQHVQIRDLISGLSEKKSEKRRVTFI